MPRAPGRLRSWQTLAGSSAVSRRKRSREAADCEPRCRCMLGHDDAGPNRSTARAGRVHAVACRAVRACGRDLISVSVRPGRQTSTDGHRRYAIAVGLLTGRHGMRTAVMAVMACLNGGRIRAERPGVPLSPAELAADAVAVRAAGAFAVHIHPRDRHGVQTMEVKACDAAVAAIRAAVPQLPIGVSTSAAINPDPFARAAAVAARRPRRPRGRTDRG